MDYDDLQFATEFMNRATVLRDELGGDAYRRAMRRALVALGDAVIDEAEHLAQHLALRRHGTVVPFTGRVRPSTVVREKVDSMCRRDDSGRTASETTDPEGLKRACFTKTDGTRCGRMSHLMPRRRHRIGRAWLPKNPRSTHGCCPVWV
ncbi:hypothetical protein MKK63_25235 [Methylobacterium sp. J-088]|uniref:hypothetical protein n=1 Tax=Methylobacterium sp. J-088 TaxID=2836664 RepID=UPI001FBACF26|nr:hypothetical protein [Methylobacterium sp. J-088]MCJ2065985.1 hypothetical protein [Methylobacterium sp. J-088]